MKSFNVKSRLQGNILIIYPRGHLDAHNVAKFEKEIQRAIQSKNYNIIINGRDLNYITSAGMGIIMGYIEEVREKGGDIKLCELNSRVFETFELVGFTTIYDFFEKEEEAISSFQNV